MLSFIEQDRIEDSVENAGGTVSYLANGDYLPTNAARNSESAPDISLFLWI